MRDLPVQTAPVPSIPAESLPRTRSGAGTQQQPLRPAPRCHPDLPTSQPLDPSQQPAPSPHAIPRPRPPLHPHHPSAQPSSPPKKSAKSRTRRLQNPPKKHPAAPQEFFGKNSYRARDPQFPRPAGSPHPHHPPRSNSTPSHPGCLFLPRPVGEGRGEGLPVVASRFNSVASAHPSQATSHHPDPP